MRGATAAAARTAYPEACERNADEDRKRKVCNEADEQFLPLAHIRRVSHETKNIFFRFMSAAVTQSKRKSRGLSVVVPPGERVDKSEVIEKLRGILSNLHYETRMCGACNFIDRANSEEWEKCACTECPENNVLCSACIANSHLAMAESTCDDDDDDEEKIEYVYYCCDECEAGSVPCNASNSNSANVSTKRFRADTHENASENAE
jgi:hypothetical protein